MSRLMKGPRYLWDQMRTLRRIARVTFKAGLIIFICLVVAYSITRAILFSSYESRLKGQVARLEASHSTLFAQCENSFSMKRSMSVVSASLMPRAS